MRIHRKTDDAKSRSLGCCVRRANVRASAAAAQDRTGTAGLQAVVRPRRRVQHGVRQASCAFEFHSDNDGPSLRVLDFRAVARTVGYPHGASDGAKKLGEAVVEQRSRSASA